MIMNNNKDSSLSVVIWASPAALGISKNWWNPVMGLLRWLVTKTHWQCIKVVGILRSWVSVQTSNFPGSFLQIKLLLQLQSLVYGTPVSNCVLSKASDAFQNLPVPNARFPELPTTQWELWIHHHLKAALRFKGRIQTVSIGDFKSSTCGSKSVDLQISLIQKPPSTILSTSRISCSHSRVWRWFHFLTSCLIFWAAVSAKSISLFFLLLP